MVSTAVVVWQGVSFAGKCCVYLWKYCCKVYWRSFKSEFEQHVEVTPSRTINWLVHNSFGSHRCCPLVCTLQDNMPHLSTGDVCRMPSRGGSAHLQKLQQLRR